jgi:glycosyltransferase involved in cell wall biosynthesis
MKIVHFCAGLEGWNGMANTARQFVAEELKDGHDSRLANDPDEIAGTIDVVHIHGAWLPVLWKAAKRAKDIGAKLIIRPAGSYDPVRRNFHGWKKTLVAPFEHRMLSRADVVQATCIAEREWIGAYHPGLNIEITDLKRFFNIHRGEKRGIQPLKKPGEPLHVLYLGRRHPLKGVEFLEKAVEGLPVELHVVSDKFGEALEKEWAWADVLCLPTLSENFGRVVAEALERGKFVITTDGAPAWADLTPDQGIYLKGYRDVSDATRVALLRAALARLIGDDSAFSGW